MRRLRGALLAVCVLAAMTVVPSAVGDNQPPLIMDKSVVEVQILALNDFHGNLLPPSGSSGRVGDRWTDAGGAAYLATHVKTLRTGELATPSWSRPAT